MSDEIKYKIERIVDLFNPSKEEVATYYTNNTATYIPTTETFWRNLTTSSISFSDEELERILFNNRVIATEPIVAKEHNPNEDIQDVEFD